VRTGAAKSSQEVQVIIKNGRNKMARHNMCMRLKSGREFIFSCEKYSIKTYNTTRELASVEFENASGECPIFLKVDNIESISEYIENEEEPADEERSLRDMNSSPSMMQLARAIKKQCMRYPTYSDCLRCECCDIEGECKLGEPDAWPIDEEEGGSGLYGEEW
jgi:hypothetical protein